MIVKKLMAAGLAMILATCLFSGCSGGEESSGGGASVESSEKILYFNSYPESRDYYKGIAKTYQNKTGVTVDVATADRDTYEQRLKTELAAADAPTIFQLIGPKSLTSWKSYCADLSGTQLYQQMADKSLAMADKSLAIADSDGIFGVPLGAEGYGILYNNAIVNKYFVLEGAVADSMDEVKSFETLKEVVEDMTARKDDLDIKGVFSSTSLKPRETWRWTSQLANLPIYFEVQEKKRSQSENKETSEKFTFDYSDCFRNIFDLYLHHSVTNPKLLGTITTEDSIVEFALGQSAMMQTGNWSWSQITSVTGCVVDEEDFMLLPIYTGVEGEEKQGICIGTENYIAVNREASAEKQKAATDFLLWLYSMPPDPLTQEVLRYQNNPEVTNIPWEITAFPSQASRDSLGTALLEYAQGTKTWENVVEETVKDWNP